MDATRFFDTVVFPESATLRMRQVPAGWLAICEVELPYADSAGLPLKGLIPIDEVSPYRDFDPARMRRSWQVKSRVAGVMLRTLAQRCVVTGWDDVEKAAVVSCREAHIHSNSVTRTDHAPAFVVEGFRDLRVLHRQVLEQVLAPEERKRAWAAILDVEIERDSILRRLLDAGCPAVQIRDGSPAVLEPSACLDGPMEERVACFDILATLRESFARAAYRCVVTASTKRKPRHYHFRDSNGINDEWRMVFADDSGFCAVGLSRDGFAFRLVGFQPPAHEVRNEGPALKYFAQRSRMRTIAAAYDDFRICVPLNWGFGR